MIILNRRLYDVQRKKRNKTREIYISIMAQLYLA